MAEMKKYDIPTLEADDIEVKVKQVGEKGTVVLLYKTARTDMRYLDEIYGVNNWQVDYSIIGDALYCTMSIWDDTKNQWVRKTNCGIPSREDGDGNEKKGEASDAMKRAGFLLGIGRELYSAPFTFISSKVLPTEQDKKNPNRWVLKNPFTKFVVTDIDYDNKRKINKLVIADKQTGEILYRYGDTQRTNQRNAQDKQNTPPPKKQEEPKKEQNSVAPKENEQQKPVDAQKPNVVVTTTDRIPNSEDKEKPAHEKLYDDFISRHKIDGKKFISLRADAVKAGKNVTSKSLKELTPDEWVTLLAMMEALYDDGFFKGVA